MKKLLVALMVFIFSTVGVLALDMKVKDMKKDTKSSNLADTAEMKQMNVALKGVQNKYGPIVFVTGKADIDVAKCKTTLNTVVSIIKKYPRFLVTVEGHTDNVGSKKGNQALSQKRAEAVVAWLVKSGGVNAKQLAAKGYGDSKPIADNKTDAGRAKNRRVDFEVSKL